MTSILANAAAPSKSLSNESGWSLPEKQEIVGLRFDFLETELQHRVKEAADEIPQNESGKLTVTRQWRLVSRNGL